VDGRTDVRMDIFLPMLLGRLRGVDLKMNSLILTCNTLAFPTFHLRQKDATEPMLAAIPTWVNRLNKNTNHISQIQLINISSRWT